MIILGNMLLHDIVSIEIRVFPKVYPVCSPRSDRIWILDKATDVNQEGCFITGESLDAVLKGLTFFAFEVFAISTRNYRINVQQNPLY